MDFEDDNDDLSTGEAIAPELFFDIVAQRAIAFVHVARFAETSTDKRVKDLTLQMMSKLCMSIRVPSTAELKVMN
jgi:hypothetical protein